MNNKNYLRLARITFVLSVASITGCATQAEIDPLQNSKKLIKEGHVSLYQNGAFEVPATTIHLIPPGPGALELAMELAGVSAAQSFQESLQHARESADFAQLGINKSFAVAKIINDTTDEAWENTRRFTEKSAYFALNAPKTTSNITGASIEFASNVYDTSQKAGDKLAKESLQAGSELHESGTRFAAKKLQQGVSDAADTATSGARRSGKRVSNAFDRFVKGYAAVPGKFSRRAADVAESTSLDNFVAGFRRSERWRQSVSEPLTDVMVDTTSNYGSNVQQAFSNAGDEITRGAANTGYTLAVLKSLRWVLQGILWEASVKPIGKLGAASLGYLTINTIAYPALITVNEGVAVANIAVELTWNSAGAVYDVTAPTADAALSGLFSAADFIGSEAYAAGKLAVDASIAGGTYVVAQGMAATTATGGYVAGKTIHYFGAPIAALGVASTGTAIGVVAGGAQVLGGTAAAAASATTEVATVVAGKTAVESVALGGTALSVTAGAGLAGYELSKAVVAPTGYALGGGIVLSYGTLSQLSAQSLLAVSDAAYVVLSLEGPRWVMYAVKGNLSDGNDIPTGAVLDLESMRAAGEEFVVVPSDDAQAKQIAGQVYRSLPQKETAFTNLDDTPSEK